MKSTPLIVIIGFLMFNFSQAQDQEKYFGLIGEAWELYKTKAYLTSAKKYSEAFASMNDKGKVPDRYNAACAWALSKEVDSSFAQLFRISEKGHYTNYSHITTDSDLLVLHSDTRWNELIKLVKSNKDKAEINLDKPLVATLDSIHEDDQKYRRQIKGIQEKYGQESDEIKAHWKIIKEKDSLNLIKIKNILDSHGWLGTDIIGNRGNTTLFLTIQHADLGTQEKYAPMMREAVKKGNAKARSLALLEDRIAIRKGGKQIYGSQIGHDKATKTYYVLPLADPDQVDIRRAQVGLGKLQEYIANWNLIWDAEVYKKQLPEIQAKQKKE